MLLPYADNLTAGRLFIGVTTILLVLFALDVPAFLVPAFEVWSVRWLGFVPERFSVAPWLALYTLFTSALVHADIFHLLGNGLFFWVFGRSLERLFGLPFFLAAFPLLGAAGLLAHWALYPASEAPVIGASGAIAVMMGAYLALFPKARMKMVLFLGVVFKRFQVPAWHFLLYWAGLQLLSLLTGSGAGNIVAYAVHVGGFVAGVVGAMMWKVSYPFAEEKLSAFVNTSFTSRPSTSSAA